MFNGYFSENGYLVSQDCLAPQPKLQKCSQFKSCQPIAKVKESYFINEQQQEGSVDEKKIQKELLRNGVVVGEFKAPNRFRYYNKGILIDEDTPAGYQDIQIDQQINMELDSEK